MYYELRLKNIKTVEDHQELIEKIQKEHSHNLEGIYELYDNLYVHARTESYTAERIYYVAYTLAKHKIDCSISEIE